MLRLKLSLDGVAISPRDNFQFRGLCAFVFAGRRQYGAIIQSLSAIKKGSRIVQYFFIKMSEMEKGKALTINAIFIYFRQKACPFLGPGVNKTGRGILHKPG